MNSQLPHVTTTDEDLNKALHATLSREKEALRLFRPQPQQLPFLQSVARLRILRGAPRTGKSLTSFIETASCLTGEPIRISDTETIPFKYPTHRGRKAWAIGFGNDHISQTIYRILFTEDNGLRIIRDEHTRKWRAWNPDNEYDAAYRETCKFADPLIPPRFLLGGDKAFGWEDRRLSVFSQVTFVNGSMLYAFTSGGAPKKGDPVDLIHVDEDIEHPDDAMEWWSRLADYRGRFIWSVFPDSNNNALMDFHRLAEDEEGKPDPIAEEFVLRFRDNKFIDEKTKAEQLRVFEHAGEAVLRARDSGEFTFDRSLVYPTFNPKVHTALYRDELRRDAIDAILRDRSGEPPDDWTRYFILDPGHSICAGLFLAIPPPELGNYVIAYDEVYQRQSDAFKMAEECAPKMSGHNFHDFIIDWHGGRQTPMGMTKTVKMIYREAFQSYGLRCHVRGNDFMWGSDNVTARIAQVRNWLSIQPNGYPTLRLVTERTPHMQKEFVQYMMRIRSGDICDEPIKQHDHILNCTEYAAAANLKYILPRRSTQQINPAYRAYLKERESDKKRRSNGQDYVNLGAGPAITT